MGENKKKLIDRKLYPIDDRPVIFSIKNAEHTNYIGRYIEKESAFLLSLNNNLSDFVQKSDVSEWWYVDQHPSVLKEVLNNINIKKDKKIKKHIKSLKKMTKQDQEYNSSVPFSAPPFPNLPKEISDSISKDVKDIVDKIQKETNSTFNNINIKVVGIDEFHTLPDELLNQLLKNAVSEENFELATIIRNSIKKKNDE